MKKILQLLPKAKGFTTIFSSFYDVAEFLNKPWQGHEFVLVITLVLWTLLIKVPVFILMKFNRSLPLIFNPKCSSFVLWLLYSLLAVISVDNLFCNFIHGYNPEMLTAKAILTVAVLIWDWKETKEAVIKCQTRKMVI